MSSALPERIRRAFSLIEKQIAEGRVVLEAVSAIIERESRRSELERSAAYGAFAGDDYSTLLKLSRQFENWNDFNRALLAAHHPDKRAVETYDRDARNVSLQNGFLIALASWSFRTEIEKRLSRLAALRDQLSLFVSSTDDTSRGAGSLLDGGKRIFLVHGHDALRREQVARIILRVCGADPIILAEQPGQSRTIIEKFEDHAREASYAVVLMTSDDEGRARQRPRPELNGSWKKPKAKSLPLKPRARQNVLIELGYFMGRLGRARVCALHDPDIEMPSDHAGVEFIKLDAASSWESKLTKEVGSYFTAGTSDIS